MLKKAHPMDAIRTAVSLMGLEDKDVRNNSPRANMNKAREFLAQTLLLLRLILEQERERNLYLQIKSYLILKTLI